MNKRLAFIVLVIVLLILNFAIGDDILGNFFLGIVSALIAIGTRRYFEYNDVTAFAAAVGLGILFAPFFLYLLWYAVVGVNQVSSAMASNYLVDYVTQNFVVSIPSTFVGTVGASIVDSFGDAV